MESRGVLPQQQINIIDIWRSMTSLECGVQGAISTLQQRYDLKLPHAEWNGWSSANYIANLHRLHTTFVRSSFFQGNINLCVDLGVKNTQVLEILRDFCRVYQLDLETLTGLPEVCTASRIYDTPHLLAILLLASSHRNVQFFGATMVLKHCVIKNVSTEVMAMIHSEQAIVKTQTGLISAFDRKKRQQARINERRITTTAIVHDKRTLQILERYSRRALVTQTANLKEKIDSNLEKLAQVTAYDAELLTYITDMGLSTDIENIKKRLQEEKIDTVRQPSTAEQKHKERINTTIELIQTWALMSRRDFITLLLKNDHIDNVTRDLLKEDLEVASSAKYIEQEDNFITNVLVEQFFQGRATIRKAVDTYRKLRENPPPGPQGPPPGPQGPPPGTGSGAPTGGPAPGQPPSGGNTETQAQPDAQQAQQQQQGPANQSAQRQVNQTSKFDPRLNRTAPAPVLNTIQNFDNQRQPLRELPTGIIYGWSNHLDDDEMDINNLLSGIDPSPIKQRKPFVIDKLPTIICRGGTYHDTIEQEVLQRRITGVPVIVSVPLAQLCGKPAREMTGASITHELDEQDKQDMRENPYETLISSLERYMALAEKHVNDIYEENNLSKTFISEAEVNGVQLTVADIECLIMTNKDPVEFPLTCRFKYYCYVKHPLNKTLSPRQLVGYIGEIFTPEILSVNENFSVYQSFLGMLVVWLLEKYIKMLNYVYQSVPADLCASYLNRELNLFQRTYTRYAKVLNAFDGAVCTMERFSDFIEWINRDLINNNDLDFDKPDRFNNTLNVSFFDDFRNREEAIFYEKVPKDLKGKGFRLIPPGGPAPSEQEQSYISEFKLAHSANHEAVFRNSGSWQNITLKKD